MDNTENYMTNAQGHLVPMGNIKATDLLEDQTVQAMIANARAMHEKLADFKAKVFADFAAFQEILFEKYNAKRGGEKGNVTLLSFDGTLKVQVQVADNIVFGPELQAARALIGECIITWSAGGNQNIRALVDKAFATDKEGKVNREALPWPAAAENDRRERKMGNGNECNR